MRRFPPMRRWGCDPSLRGLRKKAMNTIQKYMICGGLAAAILAIPAEAQDSAIFPPISAKNLAGEKIVIPGELRGEINLVLLAFERTHRIKSIPGCLRGRVEHPVRPL